MARLSGPFIPAIDGASEDRRLRIVGAGDGLFERRKITVLHVGDVPEDTFLIGQLVASLPSFSATFVAAGTREAVLSAIGRHHCDILLCDFWMASRTTVSLIREIKMVAPTVPVILTSSLDNDDIELISRRAGADGLLSKGDLAVATLDRVFSTLLPRRPAPPTDVATTLRALMASLYATGLALRPEAAGADDPAAVNARQAVLVERVADLGRASRAGAGVMRFDAVSSFADAMRKQRGRGQNGGVVRFLPPSLPLPIETSPTLFGDLIEGFFAEAGDAAAAGAVATVAVRAVAGRLVISIRADGTWIGGDDAQTLAAADERRRLVTSLALACGGAVDFSTDGALCLSLPLRLSGIAA